MRIKDLFENNNIVQVKNDLGRRVDLTIDGWIRKTGVPKKVLYLMAKVGDDQRGRPEAAMYKASKAMGSGELAYLLEHVGDLSNRMSPMHSFGFALEETKGKTEKCIRSIGDPYSFYQRHNENIQKSAESQGKEHWRLDMEIDATLSEYMNAHAFILKDAVFPLQKVAIQAAISLGKQDYHTTLKLLKVLVQALSSEQSFANEIRKYDKKFDVYMKGEELL